jgi:hypothetical protein
MARILHQLGYRFNWNIESILDEGTGDGVIAAPRYMPPGQIAQLDADLRSQSLFDPQFFIPNSRQGHLSDYPFFPDVIADGFDSSVYGDDERLASARLCLKFQAEHGFDRLVIPTRYREATPSDFIDAQLEFFVEPFFQAYQELGFDTPMLLQLILNDAMLKDAAFRNSVLNWVTGIREIQGVYFIPQLVRQRKQVTDIEYLLGLLEFVHRLRINEMEVVVGYMNTEALLLLVADPTAVTMGSYENLRMFNLRAFEEPDGRQMRGPTARIYVSRLLQWVSHQYIGAINRVVQDPAVFFDESQYRVTMFNPAYNWHFQRPEPYKHHFLVFSEQLRTVANVLLENRISHVRESCRSALEEFRDLEQIVVLDYDSGGEHLPAWITTLNLYERQIEEE